MIKNVRVGSGDFIIVEKIDTDLPFAKKGGRYKVIGNNLCYMFKYPKRVKVNNEFKWFQGMIIGELEDGKDNG